MADITPPYIPVDGQTFNPDQWNRDLDSTAGGESIFGELDGRLTDANFDAPALIRPEHPKPLETFRWRKDHLPMTVEYYQDAFNTQENTGDSPVAGVDPFVPVAGAATRLFLPYACTAVMFQVSAFYTLFQMRERATGSAAQTRTGAVAQLKVYIDDVGLTYTQRRTPRTYWPASIGAPVASSWNPTARENRLQQQWNIAHLAVAAQGGVEASRCAAGWHQVDIRLYMPPSSGYEEFVGPYKKNANAAVPTANIEYPIKHRIRFGIRSARILAFL